MLDSQSIATGMILFHITIGSAIFIITTLTAYNFVIKQALKQRLGAMAAFLMLVAFFVAAYAVFWLGANLGMIYGFMFVGAALAVMLGLNLALLNVWEEQLYNNAHFVKMNKVKRIDDMVKAVRKRAEAVPVRNIDAGAEWGKAQAASRNQDALEAAERLFRIRRVEPDNPYVAFWLGRVFHEAGFNWLAAREFDAAMDKIGDMRKEDFAAHQDEITRRMREIARETPYPDALMRLNPVKLRKSAPNP